VTTYEVFRELPPVVGRPPETELGPRGGLESPSLQLTPRGGPSRGTELLCEELLGLLEQRSDAVRLLPSTPGFRAAWRKRDPESAREPLDRFGEREPFDLHHELEDIPAPVAAEAVVETFVGIDRERRRLLVVEGAQAFVFAPPLPETDVLAHHLHQIGGVADLFHRVTSEVEVGHQCALYAIHIVSRHK
jgi:hypothetical protein